MATLNKPGNHGTMPDNSQPSKATNGQDQQNNTGKSNNISNNSINGTNNTGIFGNNYISDTRNPLTDANKLTSFSSINSANQYFQRTSYSNNNNASSNNSGNNSISIPQTTSNNMSGGRVNTNLGSTPPVNMNPRTSFSNFLPPNVRQSRNLSFSNLFFNPSDAPKDDVPFSFLPHLNENINISTATSNTGTNSGFPAGAATGFTNQDLNFSFSASSGTTAAGNHLNSSQVANANNNNSGNSGVLPHPGMIPPSGHQNSMITPGSAPVTSNDPLGNSTNSAKSSIGEPLSQRVSSFYMSPTSNQQQAHPQASSAVVPPVFNTEVFANANSANGTNSANAVPASYNPNSSSSSSRNQSLGNIFNYAAGDINNLHRPSIGFGFGGFYTGSQNGSNGNLSNFGGLTSTTNGNVNNVANNNTNNNNNSAAISGNTNNRRNSSILPSLQFQEFGNDFDSFVKKDGNSKANNDFQFPFTAASSTRNSITKPDENNKFSPVFEEPTKISKVSKTNKKNSGVKKNSKNKNQSNKSLSTAMAERISLDVNAIDEKQELLEKNDALDSEKPKLGATKVDQLMLVIQARAKGITKPISQAPDGSILNDSEVLPSSIELIGGVDKIDAETKRESKKKLQCKYCQKIFTQATHLEVHLRSHIGYKPFKCNVCDRSFTQGGNLRTHLRSHTGEKPFKCEDCGREFSRKGNLEAHMYTHSNAKPFKCHLDNCDKAFNQLGNLKAHQNRFHLKTVAELTHKLAILGDDLSHLPTDERQTIEYFMNIYKNSNKGIKGRGKKLSNSNNGSTDFSESKVTKPKSKPTKANKLKSKNGIGSSTESTINPAEFNMNQSKLNSAISNKESQNASLAGLQMPPPLQQPSANLNPMDFPGYPMNQQHSNTVSSLNYPNYTRYGVNNNQQGNNSYR